MSTQGHKPFSVRHGYKQPQPIQHESMDEDLRNGLWNVFDACFPNKVTSLGAYLNPIFAIIWTGFLKKPRDERSSSSYNGPFVKNIFLESVWYEVFNLIEFIISPRNASAIYITSAEYISLCNQALEAENSAYRIVNDRVTPITSELEIKAIEDATVTPHKNASDHIKKALAIFSRRENPDLEASIQNSIFAVESIIKEITGKSSFASGVNELANHGIKLHRAHQEALKKLYGFTSNADGIRHAKQGDEPLTINKNTARLMLITCSAFVNYIVAEEPRP